MFFNYSFNRFCVEFNCFLARFNMGQECFVPVSSFTCFVFSCWVLSDVEPEEIKTGFFCFPIILNRPRPNIISRPKVFLVKESTRIKIILITSYFFSEIELATIDIHSSHRTIQLVHRLKASCDSVIIFGDVYYTAVKLRWFRSDTEPSLILDGWQWSQSWRQVTPRSLPFPASIPEL